MAPDCALALVTSFSSVTWRSSLASHSFVRGSPLLSPTPQPELEWVPALNRELASNPVRPQEPGRPMHDQS